MVLGAENRMYQGDFVGASSLEAGNALYHDISVMDQEQLSAFVRRLFLHQPDFGLLPPEGWQHMTNDRDAYTNAEAGAEYLAMIYRVAGKSPTSYPDIDPAYKQNLKEMLVALGEECLNTEGELTEEVQTLADGVFSTISGIRSSENPENPNGDAIDEILGRFAADTRFRFFKE